ncbi:acyl-CoA dehydrogenase family protein [Pseudenhygromyxa sp. WMMC2535]|uniref:acyl-CoA dehydrogenase family protein n=1 Tax=Pseudenhygromyxa sp. WMMC2535 TaxID=2712867 RepID=UPI001553799E|nr:acyl-CoA dehydrogenase family protein [Pseudenhygromyxa sp. WMMC2535]NVB42589.1 acyl-CoA dehydrogenase family protein [Pseudenhygromyxa sp. WMMC2535]
MEASNDSSADFGFDEEAELLKTSARRLLQDLCPVDALHRLIAADTSDARASQAIWDRDAWAKMVELGWPAIAVPEDFEGIGMGLPAVAGLAEELGGAAFPSPLPATLRAAYVLAACDPANAGSALAELSAGKTMSLAVCDRRGSWSPASTELRATLEGGRVTLDGDLWYVQDAQKAEAFVVAARGPEGLGLYIVDADSPGLGLVPDAINDLTRDQARLELRGVALELDRQLSRDAEAALLAAEPAILVLLAADMVGAAEWQLQTTAEYARTRVQFDRPLGFFQAVKHPLVDMMVAIDEARSLVYAAAASVEREPARAMTLARMAKSAASDAAAFCSGRSVQLHGGVGFTWECFVQLYFKRQKHSEALFGDGRYQRAKLADMLIGPIAQDSIANNASGRDPSQIGALA